MSLQKPSLLKYQSNLQSHSKNKFINSLISRKLFQQKQQVKTRFVKLVKKASEEKEPVQQTNPHQQSNSLLRIRKRATSLKNINSNISMEKITRDIMYDSMILGENATQQARFVISRQYKSPLASQRQVHQVSTSRQHSNLFEVKLSQRDTKGFQYMGLELETPKNKSDGKQIDLVKLVEEGLDNQLWLPGLPHTEVLLDRLDEDDVALGVRVGEFSSLPVVKGPTFAEYRNDFCPIVTSSPISKDEPSSNRSIPVISTHKGTSSSKLLPSLLQPKRQEISYDFRKYHKDDYTALQKWFQRNITIAHKHHSSATTTTSTSSPSCPQFSSPYFPHTSSSNKSLLTTLYSIHIAGFQQLLRLTYVQTWQKALLFQKMFWSLIRLFTTLMQHQHRINFEEYKQYQKELREQRVMYEGRCEKLEIMMLDAQSRAKMMEQLQRKLSLAYVTYSRVNRHLSQELEHTTHQLTLMTRSHHYLTGKMMRLIAYLQQQDLQKERIKVIVDEEETTYYLVVGGKERLEELVRVKTGIEEKRRVLKGRVEREVREEMGRRKGQNRGKNGGKEEDEVQSMIIAKRMQIEQKLTIEQQQQSTIFPTRTGTHISHLQHQLTKYWHHKHSSLNLTSITSQQLLHLSTCDIGTSTSSPFQSLDFGCQFPQHQEKPFAQFLKEEIEKGRVEHEKERSQQQDLYVSLREVYEESYRRVRGLEGKVREMEREGRVKEGEVREREGRVSELEKEVERRVAESAAKTQAIEALVRDKLQQEKAGEREREKFIAMEKKLVSQLENNQALVRSNLQFKEKLQKLSIKLKDNEQKLLQNEHKKNQIQIQLQKTSDNLQTYKEKHEDLHQRLIKIAPSVDSFLDFKRYDYQAIVIVNVKKDLEKYFSEYFCKDSDVFLTKG